MTVDWGEFLQHIILNPVDNIGELVSSWKHNLVRSVPVMVSHFCKVDVYKNVTLPTLGIM